MLSRLPIGWRADNIKDALIYCTPMVRDGLRTANDSWGSFDRFHTAAPNLYPAFPLRSYYDCETMVGFLCILYLHRCNPVYYCAG